MKQKKTKSRKFTYPLNTNNPMALAKGTMNTLLVVEASRAESTGSAVDETAAFAAAVADIAATFATFAGFCKMLAMSAIISPPLEKYATYVKEAGR